MGAIRVIQAFTTEEEEHRRFVERSTESLAANLRLYTFQSVYSAFVNVLIARRHRRRAVGRRHATCSTARSRSARSSSSRPTWRRSTRRSTASRRRGV